MAAHASVLTPDSPEAPRLGLRSASLISFGWPKAWSWSLAISSLSSMSRTPGVLTYSNEGLHVRRATATSSHDWRGS
jgi:hypothetical protein